MIPDVTPAQFFLGWDVGGWNCDENRHSRDAIVIIDGSLAVVGQPWRGNLRECIAIATTTTEWLHALFAKCEAKLPAELTEVTLAIDTPLGFPKEFVELITRQISIEPSKTSGLNSYLFRHTERHLFARERKPLSAIKDMIGSQATKGIHALAKFAPKIESCGVWTDGQGFRAIETYPAACHGKLEVQRLLGGATALGCTDKDDARLCALVAYLFANDRCALEGPTSNVPESEGWIWVPWRCAGEGTNVIKSD